MLITRNATQGKASKQMLTHENSCFNLVVLSMSFSCFDTLLLIWFYWPANAFSSSSPPSTSPWRYSTPPQPFFHLQTDIAYTGKRSASEKQLLPFLQKVLMPSQADVLPHDLRLQNERPRGPRDNHCSIFLFSNRRSFDCFVTCTNKSTPYHVGRCTDTQ